MNTLLLLLLYLVQLMTKAHLFKRGSMKRKVLVECLWIATVQVVTVWISAIRTVFGHIYRRNSENELLFCAVTNHRDCVSDNYNLTNYVSLSRYACRLSKI